MSHFGDVSDVEMGMDVRGSNILVDGSLGVDLSEINPVFPSTVA